MAAPAYTTEGDVYRALKRRFAAPEYAVLPGVRDGTGSHASREIDALMMSLWPSRGLLLHGVEIKVTRSDWLRELRDPGKQESIFKRCDRFWLAVGDAQLVKPGEVPETWGLLVPHRGGSMKIRKRAPELSPSGVVDRQFLAAILRRVHEGMRDPDLEASVRAELRAEYDELLKSRTQGVAQSYKAKIKAMEEKIRKTEVFEKRAGVTLSYWGRDLDAAAKLLKLVHVNGLDTFMTNMRRKLELIVGEAQTLLGQATSSMEALDELEAGTEDQES